MLDVGKDFPFLNRQVDGKRIIYLDSAATTQKPRCVIDKVTRLYTDGISNVHRALNFLAEEVTVEYEYARESIARFIGCSTQEIIFTANATHGFNLVAGWITAVENPKILTTTLEHHSNLLPWQKNATVDYVDWNESGGIDLDHLKLKLAEKPDLFTIGWCSNLLGYIQPIKEIISLCKAAGVPTLVDASQSIPHIECDVRELDCDYLIFSSHKIYGPSGLGVLYVRDSIIQTLSPLLLGGSMVKEVHDDNFVLNDLPFRFEAGTPNIEGVIGLAESLDYLLDLGFENISAHENALTNYAKSQLAQIEQVKLLGPSAGEISAPLISFVVDNMQSSGIAKIMSNRSNIVMRSGFHCAQPAHDRLNSEPSCRISFGLYNTTEDIDEFMRVLKACIQGV